MEAESENKLVKSITTILRKGYGTKSDEELRLDLCTYAGKPYLSLRLWWLAPDGKMAPSKKGISIRLGELGLLKDALDSETLGKALKPFRDAQKGQSLPGTPKPVQPEPSNPDEEVWQ